MSSKEDIKRSHRIPRRKSAGASLIGCQISISWPQDHTLYPARCVDYNPSTGKHKVLYYSDDSIEVLSLSERSWHRNEEVHPDLDPGGHYALIGRMIILPTMTRESESSAKTEREFLACVHEVIKHDAQIMHQVVYVKSDFIATVDLSEVKYIVVDNMTGDIIRVVNEDKALVQLDITKEHEEPAADSGARFEEQMLAEGNASSASISPGKGNPPKDDATNAATTSSKNDGTQTCQGTNTTTGIVEKVPLATPATGTVNQVTHNDDMTARTSEQHDTNGKKHLSHVTACAVDQQPSLGDPSSRLKVHTESRTETESAHKSSDQPSSPTISNATVKADSPIKERNGGEPTRSHVRTVLPETLVQTIEERKKEEMKRQSPKKRKRLRAVTKSQKGNKYAILRLRRHIAVKTESNKVMRKAYVESFSEQDGTHFVTFCDATGGSTHIRLTKDNHRMLRRKEVELVAKWRALTSNKRFPQRSRAGLSRAAHSSKRVSPAVVQTMPSPKHDSVTPSSTGPNPRIQHHGGDAATRTIARPSSKPTTENQTPNGTTKEKAASGSVLGKRGRTYNQMKQQMLHEILDLLETQHSPAGNLQVNLVKARMETETALVETIIAHRKLQKSLTGDSTLNSERLRAANDGALADLSTQLEKLRKP